MGYLYNETLAGVDEGVGNQNDDWVRESQGDGSNGLDTRKESVSRPGVRDIQNVRGKAISRVEDLHGGHTVREWGNIRHVQKSGFGRANLGTGGDNLHVRDDFNCVHSDICGGTRSLEGG